MCLEIDVHIAWRGSSRSQEASRCQPGNATELPKSHAGTAPKAENATYVLSAVWCRFELQRAGTRPRQRYNIMKQEYTCVEICTCTIALQMKGLSMCTIYQIIFLMCTPSYIASTSASDNLFLEDGPFSVFNHFRHGVALPTDVAFRPSPRGGVLAWFIVSRQLVYLPAG